MKVLLQCDALKDEGTKYSHRHLLQNSDMDDECKNKSKKKRMVKDKNERVQETVEALKEQHGESAFTMMQLRIWSEMLQ